MDEFSKRLKVVHKQTQDKPWWEGEYEDYTDFRHFVQFVNAVDNLPRLQQYGQPFFFRGQSGTIDELKPTLFRLLEDVPLENALGYEFDSVCYFKERAHLFATPLVPAQDDFMEWLSLMQHFSAPTRLLDWTSSFIVALYFAVFQELDKPGAVWLMDTKALVEWMHNKYPDPELLNEDKRRMILSSRRNFIEFGLNRAQMRLDGYDPNRKCDRVTAQRGIFTFCESLFVDHAHVIGAALLEGAEAQKNLPLCKIIVSPEAKRFFRAYLSKLNVTAATLFPGTDGFGRTIRETIVVHRETLLRT